MKPAKSSRQTGFTLLEVVITVAVLGVLITAAGDSMQSSQDTLIESSVRSVNDDLARRVTSRLTAELRFADRGSLGPASPAGATSLQFQKVEGWSSGSAVLGAVHTVSLSGDDVLLDGQAIASGVASLTFTESSGTLRVVIVIQTDVTTRGATRTIQRTVRSDVELMNP